MTAIRCHYNEPAAPEYLALRQLAKMGKRSLEGAEKALGNALFTVTLRTEDNRLIGMGRVIGDGGLTYLVTDVAVSPQFQGQGLGKKIVQEIRDYLEREALPSAYICLVADVPANHFYEKYGFKESAPESVAMFIRKAST